VRVTKEKIIYGESAFSFSFFCLLGLLMCRAIPTFD